MDKRYQVRNFDGSLPFDAQKQYDYRVKYLKPKVERGIKNTIFYDHS